DTRHPTPDTRHPTPDTRHPTPDTRHPTPDTRHPTPDIQPPTTETQHVFYDVTSLLTVFPLWKRGRGCGRTPFFRRLGRLSHTRFTPCLDLFPTAVLFPFSTGFRPSFDRFEGEPRTSDPWLGKGSKSAIFRDGASRTFNCVYKHWRGLAGILSA
ncbi:hypothetical protein, partial [Lonsdalea quercina]|uniref:hypothetical protein n=1 Tax=Lonsdalea quercina TaxID=71657 RepID=UPI0039767754